MPEHGSPRARKHKWAKALLVVTVVHCVLVIAALIGAVAARQTADALCMAGIVCAFAMVLSGATAMPMALSLPHVRLPAVCAVVATAGISVWAMIAGISAHGSQFVVAAVLAVPLDAFVGSLVVWAELLQRELPSLELGAKTVSKTTTAQSGKSGSAPSSTVPSSSLPYSQVP